LEESEIILESHGKVKQTVVNKLNLLKELLETVPLWENVSTEYTYKTNSNIKMACVMPDHNLSKPFRSKPNEWFGFKINPTFYFLLKSNGIDDNIFKYKNSTDLKTPGDYLLVYTALLKICSCTKSKQFIRFCHAFEPSSIFKPMHYDTKFTQSTALFMNGIILNPYNYVYLLTKFSQIINNRKLLLAHLNILPKFFDRDNWWFDIRYTHVYNFVSGKRKDTTSQLGSNFDSD